MVITLKFVVNVLKQMVIKSLAMTIAKLDLIKKGIQLKLVLIKSNMLYQLKSKKIKVLVTFSYGAAQAYDFTNRLYNVNARLNLTNNIIWNTRLSQFEDQYNLIKAAYPSIVNTKQQEVDSNIKWQFTPSQNILFGVEHNKTTAEKVVAYNGDTGFDNSNKTTGYYLQHQYQHDGINTQAGIRVEDNDQFGTHTVGQLAGRFLVTPTTSVYANIGTAFRAPVVGQIITEPAWWEVIQI